MTTEAIKKVNPIWKCRVKNCNFTGPPTLKGYNKLKGHQLGHSLRGVPKEERGFQLIDEDSGEVLAQTLKEAREKGLLELELKPEEKLEIKPQPPALKPPEEKPPEEKPEIKPEPKLELEEKPEPKPEPEPVPEPEPEPEPEPKAKAKEKEITEPQVSSDGIFKYTITLPSDAFTLFNLAKAFALEKDSDKPFDEWIWDCVVARFKYDYKMQLVLAPIQEEKK